MSLRNGQLIIPKTANLVPAGFALSVRNYLIKVESIDEADEYRRKVAALRKYVTKREHKTELEAAERWCEVRIGELLPPAEKAMLAGKGDPSLAGEGSVPREDRHKFRMMALEKRLVAETIEKGDTSRKKILDKIEEKKRLSKAAKDARVREGQIDVTCERMEDLLPKLSGIDAIVTDPPYGQEHLPLYGTLAQLAKASLNSDGILAVLTGQSYLPEILETMTPHLPYRWTMAYLTPGGQSVKVWPRKVNTFWKPVLLFGGGSWLGDVVKSAVNDNDKRHHEWGQSESGMTALVSKVTEKGQLVCDPFLGAGTTGVVCTALGRRFVGCDMDAENVKIAKKRIKAEMVKCLEAVDVSV